MKMVNLKAACLVYYCGHNTRFVKGALCKVKGFIAMDALLSTKVNAAVLVLEKPLRNTRSVKNTHRIKKAFHDFLYPL